MSDSKKKILFIIPSFGTGGTSSALLAMLQTLENTFDCNIFSMCKDGEMKEVFKKHKTYTHWLLNLFQCDFSKCSLSQKAIVFILKCIKRLILAVNIDITGYVFKRVAREIEKKDNFDTIIAYQEGDATAFVSYFKNKNKIAWIHCDYSFYTKADESKVYEKFKKIVCVSKYTANVFKGIYPRFAEKTTFIYNLCDYDKIVALSNKAVNDSRFSNNDFTIVSIGRINKIKRFEHIPQIAYQLKNNGISFKWYLIGSGDDIELNNKIHKEIESYKVNEQVVLLGHKSNVYPFLKNSNLLVALSRSEACPMIFIEAKALNIPIVTTDFKTAFEFVDDGKNGLIAPIESIADKIGYLAKNKEIYQEFISTLANNSIETPQDIKSTLMD